MNFVLSVQSRPGFLFRYPLGVLVVSIFLETEGPKKGLSNVLSNRFVQNWTSHWTGHWTGHWTSFQIANSLNVFAGEIAF
jgi:hypothetical protein